MALEITEVYDESEERRLLTLIIERRYGGMLAAVHELVRTAFPEVEAFRLDDAATRRILAEAARRVVRIDETTRQAIAEQLRIAQERGYSTWEAAHGVADDGYRGIDGLFRETWKGRPATVARTELQHAQIQSSLDRYEATGLVDRVQLVDGDEDAGCAARNGKVVPMQSRPGLLHPNCTLLLVPVLREGLS